MARVPGGLWKNLIALQVFGANTGVGKTVFSTLLGAHFGRRAGNTKWRVKYIKPVSTGPAGEADDSYVHKYSGQRVSTLFKFDEAVSPHVAARGSKLVPSDELISQTIFQTVQEEARAVSSEQGTTGLSIIETAGGVLSPGPSGTPQADLLRPLRLPSILVGDHRLGGIASTISAAESLIMRGYDIDAVVCFEDQSKYENAQYLNKYFKEMGVSAFILPWIPNMEGIGAGTSEEMKVMQGYYESQSQKSHMNDIAGHLVNSHSERLKKMDAMASRTSEAIWHPFTQHKHVKSADDILVFDSAYGDYFQVKRTGLQPEEDSILYPAFDGSASWWTQGLGHGNPRLALEAAYAAGRYGHVMFAGATHEPALTLAETLLEDSNNPRLKKVFYTDNGSTATEVAIKMALRATSKRYDWDSAKDPVGVIGLKGSYHGDTIGAMDASEPCVFNEKVDWYRGRGFWFEYPTFKLKNGQWVVEPPVGMQEEFGPAQYFDAQDDIFNLAQRGPYDRYEAYIEKTLDELVKTQGRKFGALVMEPVILGAGGMMFVDPLFQQSLVHVVRRYDFSSGASPPSPSTGTDELAWSGLPVVFDEVFTGLYRLGRFTSASFLNLHPDISVHAKLLTGGLLPLSITAASTSIFQAFWGDEKAEALLHGHSYTAHAVGCHVANTSLQTTKRAKNGEEWAAFKQQWAPAERTNDEHHLWSAWSKRFVYQLSKHPSVEFVNALGSVLAVSIVDEAGSGMCFFLVFLTITPSHLTRC
ncbi:bifunctional dethiobiotin synthetase/adenosylmethionine-8-amino-7-oxononanoate aminotransferase [Decorospora gaudefroyi]|uniref:Bifunctional dethiobiotin synthetase/adenosylmethionine-8-amino-7-oxononanoate aminotransferase n=1 Tax=Decorospora gaudefroyi TaxID=184978 RepID=A0A6A5KGH6_9PLEO|nr:bifunctional dethiobiotin synthetase/adenosylmethionine-8-amino-7-oxononanoate aminotransferase [Decorospora gaudefroyi]